ncbi:hypothetical protein I3760_05G220900 [Carya illinoinensis]|nr:hypothetical protein I3760_05G220900 [Carya illinoinensis]
MGESAGKALDRRMLDDGEARSMWVRSSQKLQEYQIPFFLFCPFIYMRERERERAASWKKLMGGINNHIHRERAVLHTINVFFKATLLTQKMHPLWQKE